MQLQPQHIWWLVGLALLLMELGLPGLTLFFFGLGAIVTGFVCWVLGAISLQAQIWIFLLVSIASLVALRRWLCKIFRGRRRENLPPGVEDDFVGRRCEVTHEILPDRPGRVELNGSTWSAEAEDRIAVGERVLVIGRNALTLRVKQIT